MLFNCACGWINLNGVNLEVLIVILGNNALNNEYSFYSTYETSFVKP